MYHKFRITVAAIVVMVLCMLSSTMTLSYFTDTDGTTNSFKVGHAASTLSIFKDDAGESPFVADEYTLEHGMDIPFYLEAKNTGNIPVYQRFRIVIPADLTGLITLETPSTNKYTVTQSANVYYIVSTGVLAVNETTEHWPTVAIHIGNIPSDMSPYECSDTTDNNCILGLNVYSDVIQTTGFASVEDAFTNLDNNN